MKEVFKIGLLAPLSGIASLHGEEIVQATTRLKDTLEVELDICLEVIIADDGSQPKLAVPAAKLLLEQGATVLIAPIMSNARLAVFHRVTSKANVPLINIINYEGNIHSPQFYNFAPVINQILLPSLAHLTQLYGYKIFVAAQNYEWPREANLHLKEHLKNIGADVIGEHFSNFEQHQYTLLTSEILTSSANILVLLYSGEQLVELLEYLDLSQVSKKMAIFAPNFNEAHAASLNAEARENTYCCANFFIGSNKEDEFSELYLNAVEPWPKSDEIVSALSFNIFNCFKMLGHSIANYGEISQASLQNSLLESNTLNLENQHCQQPLYLLKCRYNGYLQPISALTSTFPEVKQMLLDQHINVPNQSEYEFSADDLFASLANLEQAVFICNAHGQILWANPQMTELFGYENHELIGEAFHKLLIPNRFWSKHLPEFKRFVEDKNEHKMAINAKNIVGYKKNGAEFPVNLYVGKTFTKSGVLLTTSILDITEEQQKQNDMQWAATHDQLTRLPNRQLFRKRLDKALDKNASNSTHTALIFIDLDNFKLVNDTYGHELGDKLLMIIADILLHAARPGDTVARFGGDEFVILCEQIENKEQLAEVAKAMLNALHQPMTLQNVEYIATASIGIAFSENSNMTAEELLRNADAAMYKAKERGRDQWIFFRDSMHSDTKQKLYIAMGLHDALANNEFHLLIQPCYNLSPFKLKGGEALIRWVHKGELISPVDFIPLAETNGFIYDIGLWVFTQCCKQQTKWHDAFTTGKLEYISVNISPRQLADARLISDFEHALIANDAKPEYFLLEITETAIMEDSAHGQAILEKLKAMGFKIAIDDFGTGYSSFGKLVNLPLDILKIDRCFITPLENNQSSQTLAKMIIDLAHNLGSKVIAEGIEDAFQENFLRMHNCEAVQGYKYSRPITSAQFEELIPSSEHKLVK